MAFGLGPSDIENTLAALRERPRDDRADAMREQADAIDEHHLVEYAEECVRTSKDADQKRIDRDLLLWEAHETFMRENQEKEAFQSKLATNEPFTTALQGKMLVRRAVMDRHEFFSVNPRDPDNPRQQVMADLQQKMLAYWTSTPPANLRRIYPAMAEMAFSVGISLACKALWGPNAQGVDQLRHTLVEPWKIYRDPDARPQEPQSGLYCIHEEYVDLHVLQAGEQSGQFRNIAQVTKDTESGFGLSEEEVAKRRGQVRSRNKYRKAILVREFWGDVLDENGAMALPHHSYTVANNVVIRGPVPVTFPNLRWPIHQFAAIPSILTFHGYSLYEGVLLIWKLRNNLLNLFIDNENWRINQAFELDPSKLRDPTDTELFPGAIKIKKAGESGQAYVPIEAPTALQDFQTLWQTTAHLWENGSFVTELLKGETGERRQITKGEIEIKVQQALGVFDGIGRDVEMGGSQLLEMDREVLMTYWDDWDRPNYQQVFGGNPLYGQLAAGMMPEDRMALLQTGTDVTVTTVSELFAKADMLDRLKGAVAISESPRFSPMVRDYDLLKKLFDVLGLEDVVKTKDELAADELAAQQQAVRTQVSDMVNASVERATPPAGPRRMPAPWRA